MDIELDINVNYYFNNWGIYSVKFPICSSRTSNDGVIPFGSAISSVSIEAYLGRVRDTDDLSGETQITGLIDTETVPYVIDDDEIGFTLEHPGAAYENQNATLVFKIEITNGGTRAFYGYPVRIKSA